MVTKDRLNKYRRKLKQIAKLNELSNNTIKPSKELNEYLESIGETRLNNPTTLSSLIKRPNVKLYELNKAIKHFKGFSRQVITQVEIQIKYEGYLNRQNELIARTLKLEEKIIPKDICYKDMHGLRLEAREKLSEIRPMTVGAASRISGVSPADITILLMHLNN